MFIRLTQEETDKRLAAHRCVWCGVQLADNSPDSLFCWFDCQIAWHRWHNDHTTEIAETYPSTVGITLSVAPTVVTETYRAVGITEDATMYRPTVTPDTGTPGATVSDLAETREYEDRQIRAARLHPQTLGYDPAPTAESTTEQTTTVTGPPQAKLRIDVPRPPSALPYPHVTGLRMIRQGWHLAEQTGEMAPRRRCDRWCAAEATPVTQIVEGGRTAQTCPHCRREYLSMPIVCMYRDYYSAGDDPAREPARVVAREFTCITAQGAFYRTVARSELGTGPTPVFNRGGGFIEAGYVWTDMHRQVLDATPEQLCQIPGCPQGAERWMQVDAGATLTHHDHQWTAGHLPIRLGLCQVHGARLLYDLRRDPAMSDRVAQSLI